METLSPFTRRLLAVGLFVAALLLSANLVIVPGWLTFTTSLERLRDARYQRMQIEAIAARAPPRSRAQTPTDLYLSARTRDLALNELLQKVRTAATSAELSPRAISPHPANIGSNHLVAVDIVVEGREQALIRWLGQIEQEPPLKRIAALRLTRSTAPQQGSSVMPKTHNPIHLEATVVSAWGSQ